MFKYPNSKLTRLRSSLPYRILQLIKTKPREGGHLSHNSLGDIQTKLKVTIIADKYNASLEENILGQNKT